MRGKPRRRLAYLWAGCAGAAFLLAACAADAPPLDPRIVAKTVEIPIPVRCAPDLGPEPAYPDTDTALRAASGLYERVRLLVAGRLMRMARDTQKTAALAQCAGREGTP